MVEAVEFRPVGRRALHLPPDPHVERKCNRHDHHSTDSKYEKPPKHPHNTFKDSRWAAAKLCPKSQTGRAMCGGQPFFAVLFAGLASALRRLSIFFKTRSSRLRAVFDEVAIFSMLANASGLLVFWRNSFRKG